MRWFKHYSDMHEGRSINNLMDEMGHAGLCYFLLQEMCAAKLDKLKKEVTADDCQFSFHLRIVRQKLRLSPTTVRRLLDVCSTNGLLRYEIDASTVKISMPILLNLLDRDTKKARKTRADDAEKRRLDIDKERDAENSREDAGKSAKKASLVPSLTLGTRTNGVIALYCEQWKSKYGSNPVIAGKESGILKTLVKDLGEKRVSELVHAFFALPDATVAQRRHDLGTFRMKLTEIGHFADTGAFITRQKIREIDEEIHYRAKNAMTAEEEAKLEKIFEDAQRKAIGGSV